jgi:hypothetical protein
MDNSQRPEYWSRVELPLVGQLGSEALYMTVTTEFRQIPFFLNFILESYKYRKTNSNFYSISLWLKKR